MPEPRTFKLKSPPMKGSDIKAWEQELNSQFAGMNIRFAVTVDGKYLLGDRTATERLLYALGIPRDEMKHGITPKLRIKVRHRRLTIADRVRMAARVGWRRRLRKRYAPKPAPKPSARAAAVKRAASYIGVRETYTNGGGIINTWQRRFGFGRVAWCGIFCGNVLADCGVKGVTSRIAAVALIEEDARAGRGPFRGWTTNEKAALRGDLACIGARGQHVEMVERVNSDGSLTTIGGNVSNSVRRMHRPRSQVRGIAQVNFPG